MTVYTQIVRVRYAGDGTTTPFAYAIPFLADADLVVSLLDALTLEPVTPAPAQDGLATYDYALSGTKDLENGSWPSGATVTFNTAPPDTMIVDLVRTTPMVQPVALIDDAKMPAKTVNTEFDRLTMMVQEQSGIVTDVVGQLPPVPNAASVGLVPVVRSDGLAYEFGKAMLAEEPDRLAWDALDLFIQNVADPTADDHATNRGYVDTAAAAALSSAQTYADTGDNDVRAYADAGDAAVLASVSGNYLPLVGASWDAAGRTLINLLTPANPTDATTKAYVDAVDDAITAFVEANFLQLIGGEWQGLTNKIVDLADPTLPQEAATKAYVDAQFSSGGSVPPPADPADDGKLLTANAGGYSWLASASYTTTQSDAQLATKQPLDAMLTALAALVTVADRGLHFTGADAPALHTQTAFARTLLDDADATAARATLVLGTAATQDVGTAVGNVVQMAAGPKLPAVDGSALTNLPSSGALLTAIRVYTANDTWSKPGTLSFVVVDVVGGGGAGGSVSGVASNNGAGAGGGAGGWGRKRIAAASLAATVAVTIGAAGAAAAVGNNPGGNGGTTSFGAHLSATGGTGGLGAAAGTWGSRAGGAGGTPTGHDLGHDGGKGFPGCQLTGANVGLVIGYGADSALGNGGTGAGGNTADGQAATGYGAGGAGGYTINATGKVGGAGTAGVVIVYEFTT